MNQTTDTLLTEDEKLHREPRLEIFRDGKGLTWRQKLPLLPLRLLSGSYPGPFVVMVYRGQLMGKRFRDALQHAMRGSDHWKKEELELFAAFTAKQLSCSY